MREPLRRLTRTSGGSRDTDMNAVAVMPTSSPLRPVVRRSCAVTSTTPAASRDMAARNSSLLTPSACGDGGGSGGGGGRLQHARNASLRPPRRPHRARAPAGS